MNRTTNTNKISRSVNTQILGVTTIDMNTKFGNKEPQNILSRTTNTDYIQTKSLHLQTRKYLKLEQHVKDKYDLADDFEPRILNRDEFIMMRSG